jgi:hypothetical protein
MKIRRTSPTTGEEEVRDIDITHIQLEAWRAGALIQNVMSDLTDDEREFIKSGITSEDWDAIYPKESQ